MVTKADLLEQRERMQDDIMTNLDGLDQTIIDNVCQIVVDRFTILLSKIDK